MTGVAAKIGSAVAAGLIVVTTGAPAVPVGCGITWTRTGGVYIFLPDCSHQSPPSSPAPPGPSDPPPAAPPGP